MTDPVLIHPRSANGKTFTIMVCPFSGGACVDHDHDAVPIECVPVARVHELERARDRLHERLKTLTDARSVVFTIGDVTLFGTSEAVAKAKWTLAHLRGKVAK